MGAEIFTLDGQRGDDASGGRALAPPRVANARGAARAQAPPGARKIGTRAQPLARRERLIGDQSDDARKIADFCGFTAHR
jgi:hypothetical protein